MPVQLHPHQQKAVDKMHNGCVLYGGVGVGKSITAMAYFVSKVCGGEFGRPGTMTTPKDIYVITTAKKRDSLDWEVEAGRFGILGDPRKSIENIKITVDSWNNLKDYVEVKDAFFIFDEQRVVGYGAWSRAFIKIAKSNEWVLLSATPGDTWLDYIPIFIANGWYKHKTDFLDQHVIWTPRVKYPKVLRYQDVGALVRRRNEVLVQMPYERHTKRHPVDIWCDYDVAAFEKVTKKRWHVFENRPLRDVGELFSVMRKVVNSDASRLEAIKSLLEKHPRLIVFYNFDYELEMLRSLHNTVSSSEEPTALSKSTSNLSEKSGQDTGEPNHQWNSISTSTASSKRSLHQWPEEDPKNLEELIQQSSSSNSGDSTRSLVEFNGEGCKSSRKYSTSRETASTVSGDQKASSTTGSSTVGSAGSFATAELEESATSQTVMGSEQTASFAIAEWNGHKHEEIPATERWLYLVQYRAGAEGWNCVSTNAIVFWSQTYSYRDWWQAHGRIDRLNTPFTDLYYYHFVSRSIIDKAIRAALKAKKSFNERNLVL